MGTVAETIKEITKQHLETKKGRLYAQCVKAVGWIGGTVPDTAGIVELPTSDVSNGGIVTGAALAGERPIYVVRYQGFLCYNMITVLNYAAKSLEMWDTPCPVLVRALGMEGAIGPVASNMHHSMIMRMPGIKVIAPVTPNEWRYAYGRYMKDNCPYFISESRQSFASDREFDDVYREEDESTDCTIFLIGSARLQHDKILEAIPRCNIVHIAELKPFNAELYQHTMNGVPFGLVVDSDYTICGASEHVAYKLMHMTGKPIYSLGLDQRSAGFAPSTDNLTPSVEKIAARIQGINNATA